MSRTKVITANLTVFREADGTLHLPNGSLLPIDLSSVGAKDLFYDSTLKTVLLKHVGNALVEQSTYSSGAFAATKVTSLHDNSFVYVKEPVNDVYALQNPCCLKASAPAPLLLPSCPVVTATPAQTSAVLNWGADTRATNGWRVKWFRDALGNSAMSMEDLQQDTLTASKTNLTPNTQYWFRVSPLDPSGALDNFGDPLAIGNCSIGTFTTLISGTTAATALFYNLGSLLSKPVGTLLTITADEPDGITRTLGTYTTQAGDDNAVTLAAHLNAAVNANTNTTGYSSVLDTNTVTDDSIRVTARIGLGATMNTKVLSVAFEGGSTGGVFNGGA